MKFMRINKLFVFALLISTTQTAFSQSRIKKISVKESYISSKLYIDSNEKKVQLRDNLEIGISIVDPSALNAMFQLNSIRSAKQKFDFYQESSYQFFLAKSNKDPIYVSYDDVVEYVLQSNLLSDSDESIINKRFNYDFDPDHKELKINNHDVSGSLNPFYVQNKYLFVAKISISNSSNSPQRIHTNFSLCDGKNSNCQSSIKQNIVEKLIGDGDSKEIKLFNLYKYILPDTLIIPPNAKAEYYMSFYPPNLDGAGSCRIYNTENGLFSDFSFKNTSVLQRNVNEYYEFKIRNRLGTTPITGGFFHYVLLSNDQIDYYVRDGKIYINALDINKSFRVFAVRLNSISNDLDVGDIKIIKGYYSLSENMKGQDLLDSVKMKRKKLFVVFKQVVFD